MGPNGADVRLYSLGSEKTVVDGSGRFILALDQGTGGSAALVFDDRGQPVASADAEIRQHYPQPGWVEHDPDEIYTTTLRVAREALDAAMFDTSGEA